MAYTDTSAIQKTRFKIGEATISTTEQTTIEIGFRPIFLCVWLGTSDNSVVNGLNMYDERYSTSSVRFIGTGNYSQDTVLGGTTLNRIYAITENGFIINKCTNANYQKLHYFAIGENVNSSLRKYAFGNGNTVTSGTKKVVCGFKPKQVLFMYNASSLTFYDERYSTTQQRHGDNSNYLNVYNLNVTNNGVIKTLDDDGFTFNKTNSEFPLLWFALG